VDIGRSDLARLTVGKAVANTALRWIPFFLPTLAIAFDASTEQLTTVLGFGEVAGLSTLLAGRALDRGRERAMMTGSLVVVAASAAIALVGSLSAFAVSFLVLVVGVSLYTVSGHVYVSQRVPFERRGRAVGIFEMSWAASLLIGAPIVAVLINRFGWRGPFVAVVIGALVLAVAVGTVGADGAEPDDPPAERVRIPLTPHAWRMVAAMAAINLAGLTTIVIVGTWLDDRLDVSTSGIGLVAISFGAAELISSASSATFSDRVGKTRSVRVALVMLLAGGLVMTTAGGSLLVAVVGLLLFFLGFEYAIVTAFSIVSEAMPAARGRTLAVSSAAGTTARGVGTVASGALYVAFGITGPVALTAAAAVTALVLLSTGSSSVSATRLRELPTTG
jgi:DHA1 family inner membrane transport protein